MEAVFLKILNMSITASWLVLAVIALRFLLKKAPKAFSVILWGLVGIRLILPFSLESVLSLIPSAETVPSDIVYSSVPEIDSGIGALNSAVNPLISGTLAPNEISGANPMQIVTLVAACVWVAGIAAMLMYTGFSYFKLRRKVREAAPLKDNIYLCDGIGTPFILGVVRPQIYLPSNISERDAGHVIAHEMAHLKRHDHLWKPLGFLLLTVYWFNPVLWIAYILLCRDIELACDEKVIKDKGSQIKKSYSEALVNCSVPRKMIAACPLAFGEGSVKGRIKSVLNYKKPAFWIIIVSVVACIAVAACFLTNPIGKSKIPENFIIIDSGSELEGVSISVKEVVLDKEKPYIKIDWENKREDIILADELPFDIQYYDDDKGDFVSCGQFNAVADTDMHFSLAPGRTTNRTYYLSSFDLTKEGTYRFITTASFGYSSQYPDGYLWIDFVISSPAASGGADGPKSVYVELPSDREIAKLLNVELSKINSSGKTAYGIIENERAAVIPVGVINEEYGENSVFHDSYIVIVTESGTVYHNIDRSIAKDKVYLSDIDGDGSDEIIVQQIVSATGGAGGYNSLIYKIENGILSAIFNSEDLNQFDTGFSSTFRDGFKLEITNRFTDYKTVLDYKYTKSYINVFFNEDGTVIEEYTDNYPISVDSFYEFIPEDVDNDGVYEISCLQYTSLYSHADGIGYCKTVLKYDKNIGEFVVADAEFIPH